MAEFVVLNGARAGALFELPDMPTVVGRSPEAHFQLDDPWISSMHAMFERRGAEIWVVDLESRNGTFVEGKRVQEAPLHHGCVLRFGRTNVRVDEKGNRSRSAAPSHPTPPSLPVTRPTSRLGDPETTGPHGIVRASRPPLDPLPLGLRRVALLRLVLHVPPAGAAPAVEDVVAAADSLSRAILDEGGLVVRLGTHGVLGVFGMLAPAPGDAGHALAAARAARDAVRSGGCLEVRAALDGGEVLAGNVEGPNGVELIVLGEVADRTERVLAVAEPGGIVVGPGAAAAPDVGAFERVRLGGEELEIGQAR